ncbi:MAG: sialidase family protein [Planctomycetota bacterium]
MAQQTTLEERGSGLTKAIVAIVVLAAGGLAFGYFSSAEDPSTTTGAVGTESAASSQAIQAASAVRRSSFEMSAADVPDIIEAPALATDGDRVYLAWASQTSDADYTLLMSRSDDGGRTLSEPRVIHTTGVHHAVSFMGGRRIERQLRVWPHLAAKNGRLYALWLDGGEAPESVALRFCESKDGGESFSEPIRVRHSSEGRPTFTSLTVADDGTVVCSWLDSRNRAQQPFAAVRRPGREVFEEEQLVYSGPNDKGICPCCPTESVVTSSGETLVAFRGSESGYRDMWIGRLAPGATAFAAPVPVVSPTWEFGGCPHDGPVMAEAGQHLHIVWMDGRSGAGRVFYGRSAVDDLQFASRELAAGSAIQGHPAMAAAGQDVHVVWDEMGGGAATTSQPSTSQPSTSQPSAGTAGRAIMYCRSADGGDTFGAPIAIDAKPGVFQTRPRLAILDDGAVCMAWMEVAEAGKEIVLARLDDPASFASGTR